MARKRKKTRMVSASDSLSVRAVKTTTGPPSTTVHAEVNPAKLKKELGDFDKIEEVVAEVPREQADAVEWERTPLYRLDEVEHPEGRSVRYTNTRYGPSNAEKYGVRLRVKTDAGVARSPGPDRHSGAREVDKPRRDPKRE